MKQIINSFTAKLSLFIFRFRNKSIGFIIGLGALPWFLIRVIPKSSRATYPCLQAAFPIASEFVVWFNATLSSLFFFKKMAKTFAHTLSSGSILLWCRIHGGTYWLVNRYAPGYCK